MPVSHGPEVSVSVLIPLFNGIEFLADCLESVRAQSHPHWEILIGVNGHDPSSRVLAEAQTLAGGRVSVLHFADLTSAPLTLNRLAVAARHALVCLLDVDDLWLPDKLTAQLAAYRRGYDVIGTSCTYFGERSGAPRLPRGEVPARAFFAQNPIIHSSVLLRREDVRFREEFLYDYDLWLRLRAMGRRFFNLARPLTRHRVHQASMFNSRPGGEAKKHALLLQHAGSERSLWRARLPWPFGRQPGHGGLDCA